MIAVCIILGLLLIGSGYLNYRVIKKNFDQQILLNNVEKMFDFISTRVKFCNVRLKQIDKTQHFEADDEVGFFFRELKGMQQVLDEFNTLYIDGEKKEEQ